jgi:hypothetical protein
MLEHHPHSPFAHFNLSSMLCIDCRSMDEYLFPHLFFSITQYPYFWASGKQGAVQIAMLPQINHHCSL